MNVLAFPIKRLDTPVSTIEDLFGKDSQVMMKLRGNTMKQINNFWLFCKSEMSFQDDKSSGICDYLLEDINDIRREVKFRAKTNPDYKFMFPEIFDGSFDLKLAKARGLSPKTVYEYTDYEGPQAA